LSFVAIVCAILFFIRFATKKYFNTGFKSWRSASLHIYLNLSSFRRCCQMEIILKEKKSDLLNDTLYQLNVK
jgi:hypothetical protein